VYRTFKYPLKPTKTQEVELDNVLCHCQQLYNAALEQRISAYKKQNKTLTKYYQHKELTELRQTDLGYEKISSLILRSSLHRIDEAYKAFFRRIKLNEKPGFPRFKSKDRFKSFSFPLKSNVGHNTIHIPNIGKVKFHKYRELTGTPKQAFVKKNISGWHIFILCDLGKSLTKHPISNSVGLDLGLSHFVTLSDATTIDNPRYYKKSEAVLAKRQQVFEKKIKGSNSRKRQKILVAKAHEKIKNQRLDFCRKLACLLTAKYDLICIEKLDILGMIENHSNNINLDKSIYDVGWATFIQCLKNKAENAGKTIIEVDPKNTTQMCSGCGQLPTTKKTLRERRHCCEFCKLELDRDHNAAINIKALGLSVAKLDQRITFSEQCN